jgi:hypothetical protein
MKITNTTKGGRVIGGTIEIPPGASVEIPDAAWAKHKKSPAVAGMVASGDLVEGGGSPKPVEALPPVEDPAPAAAPTEATLYDAPVEPAPAKKSRKG